MPNQSIKMIRIPAEAKVVLRQDQVMNTLLETVEVRFPPSRGSIYADLVESIVYQQISIKAARSIFRKICDYFGGVVPPAGDLANTPVEELRSLGLSRSKAEYVRNIASYFLDQEVADEDLYGMTDKEVIAHLSQIKGVGEWTVQMILIFSMGREDVFPAADYGVLSAMLELYGIKSTSRRDQTAEIIAVAEKWRPFRTYGALLVWAWKRVQMGYDETLQVNE